MSFVSSNFSENNPFLSLSNPAAAENCATLVDSVESDSESSNSMPKRRRQKQKKNTKRRQNKKKIAVTAGRFPIRVSGYPGIQHLSASAVIPYIPLTKLKLAAKKVLKRTGVTKNKNKKRRKSRK